MTHDGLASLLTADEQAALARLRGELPPEVLALIAAAFVLEHEQGLETTLAVLDYLRVFLAREREL
jgi:hypothetical protein